ncbi:MAG: aminoacyl-histidine dipeptidase [Thermotogota bacterium]
MERVLKGISPEKVLYWFEELSKIPRCSKEEEKVSDWLVSFAKKRDLEYIQDEALNVIIRKPGTKGFENHDFVTLQGHMDMVCEKNLDTKHDFTKDPIKLRVEDDYIYATGTTLGADDGIAVAYQLALLDSNDIPHPPLEMLITSDEETGMGGANNLSPKNIKGKTLINIDSEEEGVFLVSCAGGMRDKIRLNIEWEKAKDELLPFKIKLGGLKGGHSGMEINKQRGNANKLMGRFLLDANDTMDFYIYSVNGGAKDNAIPREFVTKIMMKNKDLDEMEEKIKKWNEIFQKEYRVQDSNIDITISKISEEVKKVFSKTTTSKMITLLNLIPNGVLGMSSEIEDLVETSSNLGVVKTHEYSIEFDSATRSSVESKKQEVHHTARLVSEMIGAEIITSAPYPAWQYQPDSKIRDVFKKVYTEKFNKEPEIAAIHAGLECGLLSQKLDNVDMISFGPNMYDVHTPDEHISISSINRMWEFLKEVLKEL